MQILKHKKIAIFYIILFKISLPRIKSQHAAQTVLRMVTDVVEYCTEFLISSLNLLINSKSYRHHGIVILFFLI